MRSRSLRSHLVTALGGAFVGGMVGYGAAGSAAVARVRSEPAGTTTSSVAELSGSADAAATPADPGRLVVVRAALDAGAPAVEDAGVSASPPELARAAVALDTFVHSHSRLAMATEDPEGLANALNLYVDGWAEATFAHEPGSHAALANEISSRLCANPPVYEIILLTRLGSRITRERGIRRGLVCVFDRGHNEDLALWAALRLWMDAGFGVGSELAAIRGWARDPRTMSLLVDYEGHAALRRSHSESE